MLTTPFGLRGGLMFTTATVDATMWNRGAPRPSGGAGPVRQRDQPLGVRPAEFTDHTFGTREQRTVSEGAKPTKSPQLECCSSFSNTEKDTAQWHPCKMSRQLSSACIYPVTSKQTNKKEYFPPLHWGERSRSCVLDSMCSHISYIPEYHHCLCHTTQRGCLEKLWSTLITFSNKSEQKYWHPVLLLLSPFYTIPSRVQAAPWLNCLAPLPSKLCSPGVNLSSQTVVIF